MKSYAMKARVLAEDEVREHVADALRNLEKPDKEIARVVEASPPAVENWRRGRHSMSLHHFVNLCRASPRFKAVARKLLELEGTVDPEFERLLSETMQAYAKWKAEP